MFNAMTIENVVIIVDGCKVNAGFSSSYCLSAHACYLAILVSPTISIKTYISRLNWINFQLKKDEYK